MHNPVFISARNQCVSLWVEKSKMRKRQTQKPNKKEKEEEVEIKRQRATVDDEIQKM